MSQETKDIKTLLKHAIQGEIEGYTYYDLLSKQAANADARRRLESLRDDEKRHWNTLAELYKKHVGETIGDLPSEGISALSEVFEDGRLKTIKTEMEYINLAIEVEMATMKFYKENAGLINDDEFKDILLRLADEESSHYDILMAEKSALGGNYYWFSAGDSSPMED